MGAIILRPDREKSVLQRHPWIFSGAIEEVRGTPEQGETVEVISAKNKLLGYAAYSHISKIRARMWSWNAEDRIDGAFFEKKIREVIAYRTPLIDATETDAYRLVYAESDGIPGFIVDRYGDALVIQSLTTGSDFWKDTLVDILVAETGIQTVYERSDVDVRKLEGLDLRTGLLRGSLPKERSIIRENGLRFYVDFEGGQKTGFYLDQRYNRQIAGQFLKDKNVLNCFCYTGGFTVYALAGGAERVLSVDTSGPALQMAKENLSLNGLPDERAEWLEGDVFQVLRLMRDQARSFDAIILDPPKFAPTVAQAERAARGYKDINLLAFKLLKPGGLLFTFSCSGGIDQALFQKIIAGAAQDAGVDAKIIDFLHQAPDHPISLAFPESLYLKGLVCRIA